MSAYKNTSYKADILLITDRETETSLIKKIICRCIYENNEKVLDGHGHSGRTRGAAPDVV